MKNTILWIFFAIISGVLLGKLTFDKYQKVDVQNVMKNDNEIYMLKYGVYSNEDEMYDDITGVDRYIYIQNGKDITAYVAITKTKQMAEKIKNIYQNKNFNVTIEKVIIDNNEFIQNLTEYEKLLVATEDEKSLLIIENQILSCYEQVVVDNE